MSASSSRSQRTPLQERSDSQKNALAIRVVPYSPPRPTEARSSSTTSSFHGHEPRQLAAAGDHGSHASSADQVKRSAVGTEDYATSSTRPGALSSSSSSLTSLATAKADGVSGSVSPNLSDTPTTPTLNTSSYQSHIPLVNAPSHEELGAAPSWQTHRPLSRRRNFVTVHTDGKTFSLVPQSGSRVGARSPPASFSTTSSSHDRYSDAFTEDRLSSPVTTLPEQSSSPCTLSSSPTRVPDDHIPPSTSPWNYRMVGGLRKVPKTPDLKRSQPITSWHTPPDPVLALSPGEDPTTQAISHPLQEKSSFQSSKTASTSSETTNYKVYGAPSSPALPDNRSPAPSLTDSNFRILGKSSSPAPSVEVTPPRTASSDENYVVHGDSSPSSLAVVAVNRRLRPEYSQESLTVPPLKPGKKLSIDRLGYPKSRSRESLRRASSLASISSILSQEATRTLFTSTTAALYLQSSPSILGSRQQDSWAPSSSNTGLTRPQMQSHPHQWSSQLSTVASESEGASEFGSRSGSFVSHAGRRSSGLVSSHSRQMQSVSSSIAALDERSPAHSRSPSDPIDRPAHALTRTAFRDFRLIRHQDEHGDGLADLQALQQRPSRTKLSSFFSTISSDRGLHSSASSRANSLSSGSLPLWARLYYGSGERRFLAPSSDSMFSQYTESRPPSSFQTASPNTEHFPPNIHGQRKRPRETPPPHDSAIPRTMSMDINAVPPMREFLLGMGLRKQTSSIWSPHLRNDRRAIRYSIWEPPAITWSPEGGFLGRRNIQVILFIVGFIFPFAWMTAAFLPLPPKPQADMTERDHSRTRLGPRSSLHGYVRAIDEIHYEGARWWRRLNRYMSVAGLLVVGAVIALTVLGVRERWGSRTI